MEVSEMGLPFLPLLGLATKIVGSVLPGKTGKETKEIAENIVKTNRGVQDALGELRQFYITWFAVDKLPAWAVAIKNLWRPFLATTYGLFTMVHFIAYRVMPDKYFMLTTLSIISIFGISRGVEKIKKHIV